MAILVRGSFLKSPPIVVHCCPLLNGNFSWGVIPQKSAHCSPLLSTLTWQFWSWGNSTKFPPLPFQPIAANSEWQFQSWKVIPEKSSHCSPLQPTLTMQFQSSRGGGCLIPQKSSHCSPLQPTLTWQF